MTHSSGTQIENMKAKGHLVLIGGSEDRRGPMLILRRVVELNNAQTVAVIPTATNYPERTLADYRRAFSTIGVPHLEMLDVRNREQAEDPSFCERANAADAIFFTGGDQVKLAEVLNASALLDTIHRRYREGATVAGTSAGAAAAGNPMIFDGDGRGFRKGFVHSGHGFAFLEGIAVDTHFIRRGRIARLAQFLSAGTCQRGIGLAEDTGIVVEPSGIAEVIGRHMVTLLSAHDMGVSSYHETQDGAELTMDGLRLGFLAPGAIFDVHSLQALATPEERSKSRRAAGGGG